MGGMRKNSTDNFELAFKKLLITQWNGEDYPSFIKWALAKYKFSETGGVETERLSRDQLWQREIKCWGSEKIIKEHWLKYKTLKHSYIHVDICESPEKVTSKITNDDNSVIWWSNAFHTVNAQYVRGLQGVKDCYNVWLDQINKRNSNIWILGKDYLDRPVEGSTLKEYLNEYHV